EACWQVRRDRRKSEAVPARRRQALNPVFDLMAGVGRPLGIPLPDNAINVVFLRRECPGGTPRLSPIRGPAAVLRSRSRTAGGTSWTRASSISTPASPTAG